MTMAVLGLAAFGRVRRAVPVWGIVVLSLAGILVIHGSPRYHHSMIVLAAVLASAVLATVATAARADAAV